MTEKVDDLLEEQDTLNLETEEDETVSDDENSETEEEPKEDEESSDDDNVEDENNDEEDSELVLEIDGEDSPPQDEHSQKESLPGHLRKVIKGKDKHNRDLKKQVRELQEKLKSNEVTENKPVELGVKPTLEKMDYDENRLDSELQNWYERKSEVDKQNAKIKEDQNLQESKWQERLSVYKEQKEKLKFVNYDEAEAVAQDALSKTQQGMIVEGADNSAILIYALGTNPKKLKELSAIKEPVKFAFAVSKLETQLKTVKKKRPTSQPEKRIQGSSGSSTAVNHNLEKLRADAEKTGDYTKVTEYNRQLRDKGT